MMEPIIRRGTHARVLAVDRAIISFLNMQLATSDECRQIVILGSGRDTTYLRYRFGHLNTTCSQKLRQDGIVRWYEIDHPSVITQKAFDWLPGCVPKDHDYQRTAITHPDANNESYVISISSKDNTNERQHKSSYHLIGHDLRKSPSDLFDLISHPQHAYDTSIPTLFILECVVMYLPDDASRELLRYISSSVSEQAFAAVVLYDPVPNHDRFGEVMLMNLEKAGIILNERKRRQQVEEDEPMLSLETTRTVSDQLSKMIQCGFTTAVGCDMLNAYNYGLIPMQDVRHASRCEMLDELEEFNLLMQHYCFCVGVKCAKSDSVGYKLVEVGKDSLIGFQDGRCMTLDSD